MSRVSDFVKSLLVTCDESYCLEPGLSRFRFEALASLVVLGPRLGLIIRSKIVSQYKVGCY